MKLKMKGKGPQLGNTSFRDSTNLIIPEVFNGAFELCRSTGNDCLILNATGECWQWSIIVIEYVAYNI